MAEGMTVAAVSTPFGKGGVALIRVSGDDAVSVCEKVFFPKGNRALCDIEPRTAVYGDIVSCGEHIDDGMAVVFRAPHSYTGEDTVELTCHGGTYITGCVLEAVFAAGAHPAPAGEFTKRAFLSGKLSLSQAEAIADVIDAGSREQVRLAGANARGALTKEIDEITDKIENIITSTYAYIDYPDEDLTDITPDEMRDQILGVGTALKKLAQSYHMGKAIRDGVDTAIIGKPNTGKSSLLNMLCREERAIVTDIEGTTRDIIEERVSLGRVTLNLCDTAGIRQTDDSVEKIGVNLALGRAQSAELLLAVFDISRDMDECDTEIIGMIESAPGKKIAVLNKCDLKRRFDFTPYAGIFDKVVELSALTCEGKEELVRAINGLYIAGEIDYDSTSIVSNARQYAEIVKASDAVERAICALDEGQTQDIAALDLEIALSELSELDGRAVNERIVDGIFSRFCVGK